MLKIAENIAVIKRASLIETIRNNAVSVLNRGAVIRLTGSNLAAVCCNVHMVVGNRAAFKIANQELAGVVTIGRVLNVVVINDRR